jgi:hypothetical protein
MGHIYTAFSSPYQFRSTGFDCYEAGQNRHLRISGRMPHQMRRAERTNDFNWIALTQGGAPFRRCALGYLIPPRWGFGIGASRSCHCSPHQPTVSSDIHVTAVLAAC